MIKELTLTHFKRHRDLAVTFEPGLNVVQGGNGAGKTTVLKGILYALFGTVAAGRKDYLASWQGDGKLAVTLKLDLGRHKGITLTRTLNSAEAVAADGTLLATGHSPVTAFVEEHLGMDFKAFKAMLYAAQGDTQALLKMGAAGLQKLLETVAKVGVVDKVLQLTGNDTVEQQAVLNTLPPVPDLKEMEERRQHMVEDSGRRREALAKLEQDKAAAKRRKQELEDLIIQDIRPAILKRDDLKDKLEKFERQRADTEAERAQLASLEINEPEGGFEAAAQAAEAAYRKASDLATAYKETKARTDTLAEWLQDTESRLAGDLDAAVVDEGLGLVTVRDETQRALADAAKELAGLKEQKTHCPTCRRPYDDHDPTAWEAAVEAQRLKGETLKKLVDEATNNVFSFLAHYHTDTDYLQAYKARRAEDEARAAALKQGLEAAWAAFPATHEEGQGAAALAARLEDDYRRILATQNSYSNWRDRMAAAEQQLEQVTANIQSHQDALAALADGLDERLKDAVAQANEAAEAYEALSSQAAAESQALKTLDDDLVRLLQEIAHAQDTERRTREAEAALADAKALGDYLRKNRGRLLDDMWRRVTDYASHLAETVTEGAISNLARTADGTLTVTESAEGLPVDELSGSCQSITGLCLRLALAHLFYGDHGFILLDEATADCTDDNAARVAGMLRTLNSQTVAVTHRAGDTANANHAIQLEG